MWCIGTNKSGLEQMSCVEMFVEQEVLSRWGGGGGGSALQTNEEL